MTGRHKTHFTQTAHTTAGTANSHRVPHRRPDRAPYRRTNNPEAVRVTDVTRRDEDTRGGRPAPEAPATAAPRKPTRSDHAR